MWQRSTTLVTALWRRAHRSDSPLVLGGVYGWSAPAQASFFGTPTFFSFFARRALSSYVASCSADDETASNLRQTKRATQTQPSPRETKSFWVQWTEPTSGSVCERRVIGSLFESSSSSEVDGRGSCIANEGQQRYFDSCFVNDWTSADQALQLLRDDKQKRSKACGASCSNGTRRVLIYRGNYNNARQLLAAMQRRCRKISSTHRRNNKLTFVEKIRDEWRMHRRMAHQEAADMNRLLVEVKLPMLSDANGSNIPWSEDLFCHILNAPIDTVNRALQPLFAEQQDQSPPSMSGTEKSNWMMTNHQQSQCSSYLIPLREILARIGNDEWWRKGVYVPQLENRIHPNFDVYPPTRQEYLDLLPHHRLSNHPIQRILDIGTGTGVLAAIVLHRHPHSVAVGTDTNPRAIQCAHENMERLGFRNRVQLCTTSLFPTTTFGNHEMDEPFDLLLCNPPWIPDAAVSDDATALSWMDRAIYDDMDSGMLYGFLAGAADRMRDPNSEVWLILSDLAEHIKLRSREELLQRVHDGGLEIVETRTAKKKKPGALSTTGSSKRRDKTQREKEILFPNVAEARRAETTFLYRLRLRQR